MEKILFTASTEDHILSFHIPYIEWFHNNGYEVHVACNGNRDIPFVHTKHSIPFARSPYKISNISAYRQLKALININEYKLIHCHTPMASILTRLAARKAREKETKLIYTAHGFHFFKGAPFINWILYYPIEKFVIRYADCLITINDEDYDFAKKNLSIKNIKKVNGVGIDLDIFKHQTHERKEELRKKHGYGQDDFILVYAGELSYRKHQDLLIDAINGIKEGIPNMKLLLAGSGSFYNRYQEQIVNLHLENNIALLGNRSDVSELLALADLGVSSSRQEGLPVNVMEAIATGLPMIVTDCRGNRDLVKHNENGYVIGIQDINGFSNAIEKLYHSKEKRKLFSNKNNEIIHKYSLETIAADMEKIYKEYL